mgnify:CR=1 FL=1
MKKRRCYIYTRVSTSMQVEGYSLESTKRKIEKICRFSGNGDCRRVFG